MIRNTLGIRKSFLSIDWILVASLIPILGAGLVTMNSFSGESQLFDKQIVWIAVSFCLFFVLSFFDFRFLRRTYVLVGLFLASTFVLILLLLVARATKGAQSWFNLDQ
jgi:cell division protein FtsW (lipid II flippase)